MLDEVEDAIKEGMYASKSEFFRTLIREWRENKEVAEIKKAHQEMVEGKGILLRSLKDLR